MIRLLAILARLVLTSLFSLYSIVSYFKLSFDIGSNEVVCFFGKNGSGKSVLVQCLIGLKIKDSGEVLLDGLDIEKDPLNFKLNLGYVPSEPILYEMMTGEEYMKFIASSYQMLNSAFEGNYLALTTKFDIPLGIMRQRISTYSYGDKQKLSLMASIIHNPDLWIMDEPTIGLDSFVSDIVKEIIMDFKKAGKAIMVVSHDLSLMLELADKINLLENGKITKSFDMSKIDSNPYLKSDITTIFENVRSYKK